jgi:hypothetical protein
MSFKEGADTDRTPVTIPSPCRREGVAFPAMNKGIRGRHFPQRVVVGLAGAVLKIY